MNHYCEKYSCSISLDACKSRQAIAKDMRHPNSSEFRYAGCGSCDFTKITTHKNASQMEPEEVIMRSEIDQKKCCRCHEFKSLDQFCKNKSNKDNLDYICKQCKYSDSKKRREIIRMDKTNTKSMIEDDVTIPDVMLDVVESRMQMSKQDQMMVNVDFSGYPELYDYFIKTCKDEFMTPNMMILYMIRYFQMDWKGFSIER